MLQQPIHWKKCVKKINYKDLTRPFGVTGVGLRLACSDCDLELLKHISEPGRVKSDILGTSGSLAPFPCRGPLIVAATWVYTVTHLISRYSRKLHSSRLHLAFVRREQIHVISCWQCIAQLLGKCPSSATKARSFRFCLDAI